MVDRTQSKRMAAVVRNVIREWDPQGLFAMGAPEDEHDGAILRIVGRIPEIRTEQDATLILYEECISAKARKKIGSEKFVNEGQKLFAALKEAKLIMNEP